MRAMPHVPSQPVPRVATLLPSLTEIVASVCPESVVAITHECDHPEDVVQRALRVTTSDITPHTMTQEEIDRQVKGSLRNGHSLYGLKEDLLKQADPQIVFTQALCDVCAPAFPLVVSTCARLLGDNPKVYSIEPTGLNEVLESVRTVGNALGRQERAEQVVARLRKGFDSIKAAVDGKPRKKVAFLEWTEPLFCGGHWIPDMMDLAGADYSLAATGNRSVEIAPEILQKQDPDIILVAPCGFGKERAAGDTRKLWKHDWWRDLRAVKQSQVYALDANRYYARPGTRLLEGTGIVARLLHGDDIVPLVGEHIAKADWIRVTADDEV